MRKNKNVNETERIIVSEETLKKAGGKSGCQLFFSICLVIISLAGFDVEIPLKNMAGIILAFCFMGVGLFLLYCSCQTKRLVSKCRLYANALKGHSSITFFDLSQTVGKTEKDVMADIQVMIDRRFFATAYIDYGKKILVLFPDENKTEKEDNQQYVIVACATCGGDNKIVVGKYANCIFCGNAIDQKMIKGQPKKRAFIKEQAVKLHRWLRR